MVHGNPTGKDGLFQAPRNHNTPWIKNHAWVRQCCKYKTSIFAACEQLAPIMWTLTPEEAQIR
ncbi:MAG: hypothetical protein ACTSW1_08810 [Candidatus Hodarchaeales archaeon]